MNLSIPKLRLSHAAACLCVLFVLGCESQEMAEHSKAQPHSFVLDAPPQRRLAQRQQGEDWPWYVDRNDQQLSVDAGYQSPGYQQAFTDTYDQQYQSNGRVHDYINTYSRRTRYSESVR